MDYESSTSYDAYPSVRHVHRYMTVCGFIVEYASVVVVLEISLPVIRRVSPVRGKPRGVQQVVSKHQAAIVVIVRRTLKRMDIVGFEI